jgi:trans-2,3-dihydro-3-hydroxyanthranilate isomerase
VRESILPVEIYDNGPRHAFVALESEAAVVAVRPDFAALGDIGDFDVSCFAVIDERRVKTRMFAPALGVNEDPATGSAAGPLSVHLARHGRTSFGQPIEISQGDEIGRPSRLRATVHGTAARIERVTVGGGAVIVARGRYRLD